MFGKEFIILVLLVNSAQIALSLDVGQGTVFETTGTDTFFIMGKNFSWSSVEIGSSYLMLDGDTLSFRPVSGHANVTLKEFLPRNPGTGLINVSADVQGNFSFAVCGFSSGGPYTVERNGGNSVLLQANTSGCLLYSAVVSGENRFTIKAYGSATTTTTSTASTTSTTLPNGNGDANGDGHVDYVDLVILAASYGKQSSQASFDGRADYNGDGLVDYDDLIVLAAHYGS